MYRLEYKQAPNKEGLIISVFLRLEKIEQVYAYLKTVEYDSFKVVKEDLEENDLYTN